MAKNNALCLNCGEGYYVCRSCESIWSWRQVACCPECYRELQKKNEKESIKSEVTKQDNVSKVEATKSSKENKVVSKQKKVKTSSIKKVEK